MGMRVHEAGKKCLPFSMNNLVLFFFHRNLFTLVQYVRNDATRDDHRPVVDHLQVGHLPSFFTVEAAAGDHLRCIPDDEVTHGGFVFLLLSTLSIPGWPGQEKSYTGCR